MEIAVLGTGMVGRALAARLAELGHHVVMGTRDPDRTAARDEHVAWAAAAPPVTLRTYAGAAAGADLLVTATAGAATLEVLAACGDTLDGRVLLDPSNPLDFSAGFPPTLLVKDTDSLAEQVQRAHPSLRVVKALNTMTASVMAHPGALPEPGTVFVCGDDPGAKAQVAALLAELGHTDLLDLGDLSAARGCEMFLPLWIRTMQALGTGDFNVKVVRAGS